MLLCNTLLTLYIICNCLVCALNADKYAEPDALEFHMQVSHALREKRFFKVNVFDHSGVFPHYILKVVNGISTDF